MLERLLSWNGWQHTPLPCAWAAVYRLDGSPPGEAALSAQSSGRLEILFCRRGGLTLEIAGGGFLSLGDGQALLLSGTAAGCRCQFFPERFQGLLVSEEEGGTFAMLMALCAPLCDAEMGGTATADRPDYAVAETSLWNEALFAAADRLSTERQGNYCAMKVLELLYLTEPGGIPLYTPMGSYYDHHQLQTVREVRDYLLSHLDCPLTIPELSQRFRVSATVLKACFRQVYGAPIHQYLLRLRMARAAHLLASTRQPVIQVAAAVGYGSVSQFGAAFKARYQMPPSQYRRMAGKMSDSAGFCPNGSEISLQDPI